MGDGILDHGLDFEEKDRALLERHKPLLRFDPQYDYRLLVAESAAENPGNILRTDDGEVIARRTGTPNLSLETLSAYPAGQVPSKDDSLAFAPDFLGDARRMEEEERFAGRIYGRVVREPSGRIWLQYWFWLYYNPKSLFGIGRHEGDWEMIQVGLRADETPELVTYAQHNTGEAAKWDSRRLTFATTEKLRPVVYVAQGSHASYLQPRTYPLLLLRFFCIGVDHPRGDGPACEYQIAPMRRWARWPGHWGSTERPIFTEGKGPQSPANQGLKWTNPSLWHSKCKYLRLFPRFLGWLMYTLGRLTFPRAPEITHAQVDDRQVHVGWKLNGLRPRRHLYVTVHDAGGRVIATRIVKAAIGDDAATIQLPDHETADHVIASTFNFLRQRSDLTRAQIERARLAPMADLHAHYAMHLVPPAPHRTRRLFTELGDARFWDRVGAVLVAVASRGINYRSFSSGPRVTIGSLRAGGVKVALSVLYSFWHELPPAWPSSASTEAILRQAQLVEDNIRYLHADEALVAHNHSDLEKAGRERKVALIHCVEGGFHLGGTEADVTKAVSRLADRGIAYVTLAHLVWRHIATDAPAIPLLPDWLYRRLFPQPDGKQPDAGLSDLGQAAITAMVDKRVLIDLSHMSELSVRETLTLLEGMPQAKTTPVIATHSCFRFGSQEYALTEDTIGRIADRGGVVGLIMAQHQMNDGLSRLRVRSLDRSIEIIGDHIDRMASVTGNHDHIAIGSDLDGFIKPTMGGIESMADMARLQRELRRRYGADIAHKICFLNAMDVLKAGWGGGTGNGAIEGQAAEAVAAAPPQRF